MRWGRRFSQGGLGGGGGGIDRACWPQQRAVFLFLVSIRNPYSTCSRTYSTGLMLWDRVRLVGGEEP